MRVKEEEEKRKRREKKELINKEIRKSATKK